jgi:hypothetical protein
METIEKVKFKMLKVMDVILISLNDDIEIMFSKVFEWPNDSGMRIGKLNIWDKHAPFSIVFHKDSQKIASKKGFKRCYFIPNLFEYSYDRNNRLILKCVPNAKIGNDKVYCKLKYHHTSSIKELRDLVSLKQSGHEIYGGSPVSYGCISTISEAFEVIRL